MGKNKNRRKCESCLSAGGSTVKIDSFLDEEFSESELKLMTIQDIIKEMVQKLSQGQDVNLTRLKCDISQKYGLRSQPRLVDIISCIPPEHKSLLVPKLKAKPIRTASGIAVVAVMCKPHRCPHISMTGNICVIIVVMFATRDH